MRRFVRSEVNDPERSQKLCIERQSRPYFHRLVMLRRCVFAAVGVGLAWLFVPASPAWARSALVIIFPGRRSGEDCRVVALRATE